MSPRAERTEARGAVAVSGLRQAERAEDEHPPQESRHAWRKLAGFLIEGYLTKIFGSRTDIVTVDMCSSLPVLERMEDTMLRGLALQKAEQILGKFFTILDNPKQFRRRLSQVDRQKIDQISRFMTPTKPKVDTQIPTNGEIHVEGGQSAGDKEGSDGEARKEKPKDPFKDIRSSVIPDRGSDFRRLVSSVIMDLIHRSTDRLPSTDKIEEMLRDRYYFYFIEDQLIIPPDEKRESKALRALRQMRSLADAVLKGELQTVQVETPHIRTIREVISNSAPKDELDGALWELRSLSSRINPEVKARVNADIDELGLTGNAAEEHKRILSEVTTMHAERYRADITDIFFRTLTGFVVEELSTYRRTWTTVSLDIDDPEIIKQKAKKSFAQATLLSDLFHEASRMKRHVIGDIYRIPLKPESVDLLTSIEGWPFYHRNPSGEYTTRQWMRDEASVASRIYSALKPGGEAVFFPWQSCDSSTKHLQLAVNKWREMGAWVFTQDLTREEIIDFTRKDENPSLQRKSMIFGNARQQTYRVLRVYKPTEEEIVEKEKEEIFRKRVGLLARHALRTEPHQNLPDPMLSGSR